MAFGGVGWMVNRDILLRAEYLASSPSNQFLLCDMSYIIVSKIPFIVQSTPWEDGDWRGGESVTH
jgi:hypothetical protein